MSDSKEDAGPIKHDIAVVHQTLVRSFVAGFPLCMTRLPCLRCRSRPPSSAALRYNDSAPRTLPLALAPHVLQRNIRANVLIAGDAACGKTTLCKMLQSNGTDYPKNYVTVRKTARTW